MAGQYVSAYPEAVPFAPQYKDFFENFYKISDTPEAHELYSQQFTEDATLIMASKTAKGRVGMAFFFLVNSTQLLCRQA